MRRLSSDNGSNAPGGLRWLRDCPHTDRENHSTRRVAPAADINHGLKKMTDDELMDRTKKLADELGITLPDNLLKPARHQGTG